MRLRRGLTSTSGFVTARSTAFISRPMQVIRDPRVVGVLRAGPRVLDFLVRSHRRTSRIAFDDTIVAVRPTPALAAQAYIDEVLIATLRHPDLLPTASDYGPAAADLKAARELFSERGWLDRPETYHRTPPLPNDLRSSSEHSLGVGYERINYSSEWEPDADEPGRTRWLEHKANRTAHAWLARTPGRDRGSWLVCLHGFGMGQSASIDLRAFRSAQLHRQGINVAIPILPLHGERASGRVRGEDLMTIDLVDSMHGMAQATWEVRRLLRWLRETQGAERIGIMGHSLGGLVSTLVASLDPELACVIAGIPVVDLPDLFRRHSPTTIARRAQEFGVLGDMANEVHRVVSPLAMSCVVSPERRFIYAGLADRMSTFGQARRLWLHWDRPALATYPGGHVGFFWSRSVNAFVTEAVDASFAHDD